MEIITPPPPPHDAPEQFGGGGRKGADASQRGGRKQRKNGKIIVDFNLKGTGWGRGGVRYIHSILLWDGGPI